MVYGQGKARPVVVLDLQTGEVSQTLPSVAAVVSEYFKTSKTASRARITKALDRARAAGNQYATLLTDVPGFTAGFAWANPGQKVRRRCGRTRVW